MTTIHFVFITIAAIIIVHAMWKVFEKAGEPGWAAIVPIYNLVVMLKIAEKPTWWLILFLIPVLNFIFMIKMYIAFAKAFGKDTGFALGLFFLSIIFFPILAHDKSIQHVGHRELGVERHLVG